MPVYLNTYETHEAYGGPEEGGWWYTCGIPVQSVLINDEDFEEWLEAANPDKLHEMRTGATLRYTHGKAPKPIRNGSGGYSFMVGDDTPTTYREENSYTSCFEEHYGMPYPQERPYYW